MKQEQEHEYCSVGIMLEGKDHLKEGTLPRTKSQINIS